jgi:hypothetical protein
MTDRGPPIAPSAPPPPAAPSAAPTPPIPPTETPPARSPAMRWTQIVVGIALLVVFAVIVVGKYITRNDLPACDSTDAKDSLSDIFKAKNVDAKRYNEIKTVSTTKEEVLCNASLTLQDDSVLEIDYRFFFEGDTKKVQITAAREKPKS